MGTKMFVLQQLSSLQVETSFHSLLDSFPLLAILVAGGIHSVTSNMAIAHPLLNLHEIDVHMQDSNIPHNNKLANS
jgi:hypothetical protein